VLETATGDALAEWNKVRTAYDTADDVESVIWTTAGVVALAGVTISAVMGIFSVGIGFVAGMAITAEIELVLGIIGAVFDLINGMLLAHSQAKSITNHIFAFR
jgi:hypothetical protein